ncbi:hypothetical protein Leryth_010661 [Lithospermum erythrorhizon]|nr:hypothetical protein Leryth_010661 [Lithospermum erythrorhizon]
MAIPRRRHHHHHSRFRRLIPAISSISGSLLLLFLLFSLFAPSPDDDNDPLPGTRHDSVNDDADGVREFRVPNNGGVNDRELFRSRNSKFYYGCSEPSDNFPSAGAVTRPNRYLVIVTSGGLNQQRTGITDAVVAARILNATLVVPKLDTKSYWRDSSNFSEIFNLDWFISQLANDVKIIKQLPLKSGQPWIPYHMRVPRKCSERCYTTRVLPHILKKHAVQLSKFDYRLANKISNDLQKLRCRTNYHALKFTDPILEMGRKLIHRMRVKNRRYIALHLRFEPDMLAFSGCDYGGGEKEKIELGKIRKRWKTLHNNNPDRGRRQGKCPLTPEEVGLMLRALGYGQDVHIYVASGEVYGGEETLAPLKALFPNFHSKDTIARKEELAPFSPFSSRMAALDFIVCDESDVFVTNNNGNMAKILAGRRRYFGHKPTIRPNAKKLYKLFFSRNNMTWEEFASRIRKQQIGFMGEPMEVRPGRGEFHENPSTCICEDSEALAKWQSGKGNKPKDENTEASVDAQGVDDELEWSEPDFEEDTVNLQGNLPLNRTTLDYDLSSTDEPELDEMLSD